MIATYLRSSSVGALEWCEQKYFLSYVLGIPELSNKAADKGTIVHKVMEVFATAKKSKQEGLSSFQDDVLGEIQLKDCNNAKDITTRVYQALSKEITHHIWKEEDFKFCLEQVNNIIKHNKGVFDPRKRNVLDVEKYFDIDFSDSWAKYNFEINGKKYKGNLAIKGTIDFITELDSDSIEVIDYKTGSRKNWATQELKSYEYFQNKDFQLRLYHYALSLLYPQYKNIIITIFYSRDGGPFTLVYTEEDKEKTKKLIRDKYQEIQRVSRPKLTKDWRCKTVCHFGKNCLEGSSQTICSEVEAYTRKFGMNKTIEKYSQKDIDKYGAGGGKTQD